MNRDKWDEAFMSLSVGGKATRDRAFKTWAAIEKFAEAKKWDLSPAQITPKQLRQFIEHRAGAVSARCVQNEASHLRRAIAGVRKDVKELLKDVRSPQNPWSSARLGVPQGSRIGGKAAADIQRFEAVRDRMPSDVQAVVGLCESMGLRMKEGVMAGPNLSEWQKQLEKPDSARLGADLRIDAGTKGGRGRFLFVPPERIESVSKAVSTAQACKNKAGDIVQAEKLKIALKRVSNCLYELGLRGDDSAHGLRRAFAQRQFCSYRDAGMTEAQALKRLSNDLGHGDGRGRWVSNNYLSGGSGDTA